MLLNIDDTVNGKLENKRFLLLGSADDLYSKLDELRNGPHQAWNGYNAHEFRRVVENVANDQELVLGNDGDSIRLYVLNEGNRNPTGLYLKLFN